MDWQSALVLLAVAAAALYVGRALWPRRGKKAGGCANCSAAPPTERDDYV